MKLPFHNFYSKRYKQYCKIDNLTHHYCKIDKIIDLFIQTAFRKHHRENRYCIGTINNGRTRKEK